MLADNNKSISTLQNKSAYENPLFRPTSLNIVYRKNENKRIERENHAFAKRLYSNTGSIKKAALDAQYQLVKELRIRISKVKKNKLNVGGKYIILPPI